MRQTVPRQAPRERSRNFFEVALGLSKDQALEEADRCLQCKDPPCRKGCPVMINIPSFIKLLKEGDPSAALAKIKEKNNLPAVCGRVCPQEDQCEAQCVLGRKKVPINIGALERYVSDHGKPLPLKRPGQLGIKAAVVGSGPAGLTCAADLAKMGYDVALFESLHLTGGVLTYGIPEFRLPKNIVHQEVEYIVSLGVKLSPDTLIGRTLSLDALFKEGYKAVFIATGAGLPQFLGIPGENLGRVYSANEFLTRVNLMKAYLPGEYATPISIGKKVAVVGGGNVAFDCSRVAMRLGSEAMIVYRRTEHEMPARQEEIENAKEEGVEFRLLTQPVKVIGDEKGFMKGLECITMELGSPDATGRRRPVPVDGSNFVIDADTLIVAIGQDANPLLPRVTPGLDLTEKGTIKVDGDMMTSISGVFAGGDITTGADTVISAMGAGKRAAVSIDEFIRRSK